MVSLITNCAATITIATVNASRKRESRFFGRYTTKSKIYEFCRQSCRFRLIIQLIIITYALIVSTKKAYVDME